MAVDPPFDYIIGTDVVYAEHLLDPLLQTIFSLSGPKTTVLLGYEIRNTIVHEQMLSMWKNNFEVKTVPRTKMDSKYQHESIHLYIMESRARGNCSEIGTRAHEELNDELGDMEKHENADDGESCHRAEELEDFGGKEAHEVNKMVGINNGDLNDWQTRRYGSMAARLLHDIKIT
ncbi:S-adenosyl-l-methionine-dependent methyltransferases superfamily protein [Thalictrum thalictroides]|uniref:S-adenosyl-l-methionine-dependent methyltransferases superfamily protein n=1 Tax=Thalictrum thalictroides TaxID=46969 RepID=A0A7J6V1I9_THATH|nr:S-adenosyl-l-methionine-dependent methyltransferases superfamily protein [Thalictrum thalictroides]